MHLSLNISITPLMAIEAALSLLYFSPIRNQRCPLLLFTSRNRGASSLCSSSFPMSAAPTSSPSPPSKPREKRVCSSVLPLHASFRRRILGILRAAETMVLHCFMEITPVCVAISPNLQRKPINHHHRCLYTEHDHRSSEIGAISLIVEHCLSIISVRRH